MIRIFVFCFIVLGITMSAQRADALLCHAILGCSCSVSTADIDFQGFAPLDGAQDAQGEVSIDCTGVIDVAPSILVKLNGGSWGSVSAREMRANVGDALTYNLYSDSARTNVWGDGTAGGGAVMVSGGLVNLLHWTVSRPVYARVYPASTSTPGNYSDTIVVRIEW